MNDFRNNLIRKFSNLPSEKQDMLNSLLSEANENNEAAEVCLASSNPDERLREWERQEELTRLQSENAELRAEIERMKSQEPVAWARYPRFTGSLIKQKVVFIKPEGTNWTELYAAPPDLSAKVKELQEKLIEAEDGAGYHAQWSREFKSQLDAAKGRISELTEQVKVAREALNVLKHSTPIEGEYGRALQKTISESLAKLQGIE